MQVGWTRERQFGAEWSWSRSHLEFKISICPGNGSHRLTKRSLFTANSIHELSRDSLLSALSREKSQNVFWSRAKLIYRTERSQASVDHIHRKWNVAQRFLVRGIESGIGRRFSCNGLVEANQSTAGRLLRRTDSRESCDEGEQIEGDSHLDGVGRSAKKNQGFPRDADNLA